MSTETECSVVISTKDRKEDMRLALASCQRQNHRPEVIVVDDGSADGTAEMVRSEFPWVRLIRHEVSTGYIVARNEGAAAARGRIIFSIDDDAAFATPTVVEETLADFDHPRIGAVAIPFCNVNQSPDVLQRPPDRTGRWVTGWFIGTAHALRRDLFLQLGGYRAEFVHQGEEVDYALRLLAAGYAIRLGRGELIHHFESPRRNYDRMDYYGFRNQLRMTWHNVPFPDLLWQMPANLFNLLAFTVRTGRYRHRLRGLGAAMADILLGRVERQPVAPAAFRMFRRLKRGQPMTLDEVADRLGWPAEPPASSA